MLLLLVFLASQELLSLGLDRLLERELDLLMGSRRLVDWALAIPRAMMRSAPSLLGVLARR